MDIKDIYAKYVGFREKHQERMLLIYMTDKERVYLFDKDAKTFEKVLKIKKETHEDGNIVYSSFPISELDTYLSALLNHGYKVAMCEVENNR